jgi:hypothetical protein
MGAVNMTAPLFVWRGDDVHKGQEGWNNTATVVGLVLVCDLLVVIGCTVLVTLLW